MSLLPPTDADMEDESGLFWRIPVGFEAYWVSILGDVKSYNDPRFPGGRLLNAPSGRTLVVTDSGLRTTKSIAQLVMLAWHEPAPSPSHVAGHLNSVKSDNRAVNLFWESRHEQNLRANRVKRDYCPRGHPYLGDNLFVNHEGFRCCRICNRAHWWASKLRREAKALPFDGCLRAPITINVILDLTPDGRFPSGPPSIGDVLTAAARHQRRIDSGDARA